MEGRVVLRRYLCILFACVALAGCAPTGSNLRHAQPVLPYVAQKGGGAQWVQFAPNTSGFLYGPMVSGPDGNVWFLEENFGSLVRVSMTGAIKAFSISGAIGGNGVSM